jgi:hypothetical protein
VSLPLWTPGDDPGWLDPTSPWFDPYPTPNLWDSLPHHATEGSIVQHYWGEAGPASNRSELIRTVAAGVEVSRPVPEQVWTEVLPRRWRILAERFALYGDPAPRVTINGSYARGFLEQTSDARIAGRGRPLITGGTLNTIRDLVSVTFFRDLYTAPERCLLVLSAQDVPPPPGADYPWADSWGLADYFKDLPPRAIWPGTGTLWGAPFVAPAALPAGMALILSDVAVAVFDRAPMQRRLMDDGDALLRHHVVAIADQPVAVGLMKPDHCQVIYAKGAF